MPYDDFKFYFACLTAFAIKSDFDLRLALLGTCEIEEITLTESFV